MNFKTYLEATGKKSVELAKICESISLEKSITVVVAPQFSDIKQVSESAHLPVFSQHVDPIEPGAHTGHVLAEALKSSGATGTLINHSERRMRISEIEEAIEFARGSDLLTLVCANSSGVGAATASLNPDMIAIEPPELIGSGVAVSKARPELVTKSVRRIRGVNAQVMVLVGAGVTNPEDVSRAIELGSQGVLVSSSVVKSKEPRTILAQMADAALASSDSTAQN